MPLLVYDERRKVLQMGGDRFRHFALEVSLVVTLLISDLLKMLLQVNGKAVPPGVMADLRDNAFIRLTCVADRRVTISYIYRQRHVYEQPGPDGVYYVQTGIMGTGASGDVHCCRVICDWGVAGCEPSELGNVALKTVQYWQSKSVLKELKTETEMLTALKNVPGFVRLLATWSDDEMGEMCKYCLVPICRVLSLTDPFLCRRHRYAARPSRLHPSIH